MDLSFLDAVGGVRVVATVVAVVIVALVVKSLFRSKVAPSHFQPRSCNSCGWKGSASNFKPKCPKCGTAL